MKVKPQKIYHSREQIFADLLTSQGKEYFYQPAVFHVNGIQYRPDFYTPSDMTFYEVVGSRQAFSQNRQKIETVKKAYPFLKIMIVNPDGTPYEHRPARIKVKVKKTQPQRWTGRPPIPMDIHQVIRILKNIYQKRVVGLNQLVKDTGVSQSILSAIVRDEYRHLSNHSATAHKLWAFIKKLKHRDNLINEPSLFDHKASG